MEEIKYIYEIPAIIPLENAGVGGYGFNVNLDSKLGIKAREKIIDKKILSHFKEEGSKIVKSFFGKKFGMNPYLFVENSWLVHAICVPGDACDLSLSENSIRDFISDLEKVKIGKYIPFSVHYFPHNVDSFQQAQCLRELFLQWANVTNSCLNYD